MKQKIDIAEIFSLQFKHSKNGDILNATVFAPQTIRHFSKLANTWLEHLESQINISFNGKKKKTIVGGASWLEVIFLATECVRQHIPQGEEKEWVDERGVASWVILPKTIPIGWGYDLHQKLANQMNMGMNKYVAQIDRKRRAHEIKRKTAKKGKR